MIIFSKWGVLDLFITFTANPSWIEIIDHLKPGEDSSDHCDFFGRVIKLKLDALIKDKRGLPHVHILVPLMEKDKFTNVEKNKSIYIRTNYSRIPVYQEHPDLPNIVLKYVIHGSCGDAYPHSPCMKDGICSKRFRTHFTKIHRFTKLFIHFIDYVKHTSDSTANQLRVIFEEDHEEEELLDAQSGKQSWNIGLVLVQIIFLQESMFTLVVLSLCICKSIKYDERLPAAYAFACSWCNMFRILAMVKENICESLKTAEIERGPLQSDEQWDPCLTDTSTYLMLKELIDLFYYICIICQPSHLMKLWKDPLNDTSLDYLRTRSVGE
ncbi:hypothetical protein RF11_03635 [Thelohanellus kitauei]|uniref:Helitron helicase-like domain-containing protein n=1 Tax=Thelohanellus kitauei TaxID=669202 RepID=A0A0C2INB8_THEKT|nr:hypothetical protein RF11_03635 [Thelohanellus kitauei]